MGTEEWKVVKNFPNYMISNFGRTKRISRTLLRNNFPYILPEKILKAYNGFSSYSMIKLQNNLDSKSYLVHRLVAEAFVPNPSNLLYVNHLDGDKLNNNATNLEWVSRRENSCHDKQLKNKSSSKFTGVSFHVKSGKWYACISIDNKSTSLGYYNSELDAYNARKQFELTAGIANRYL